MNEQDYPPLPKAVREVITLHQPTEYTEHVVTGAHYTADQMRAYADASIAQQSVRHAEELAAYELTVSNLRARCMPDIHALFWVLRSKILKLPRYSFLLNNGGGVSKVADKYGKWIEKDSAAELCELESVYAMLSAAPAPTAQRVSTLPEGWRAEVKDDLFKTISIVAPNGYAAITTSVSRNPENVLRMLVQDLLAAAPQPPAQPERKPMTLAEAQQLLIDQDSLYSGNYGDDWSIALIRLAEAFHGIKETP